MTTTRVAILDLGVAPDGVSSRPGSWRLAHLVGCAVGRRSPARGSIVDADALVVFDFGTGRDGMPAKSNEQLARVALRFGTVPLLAQTEAAWLMATTGRVVIEIEALARRHHDCDERYVDTTSAARAAADLLAESPLATVGVIAHPAHAARCAAICDPYADQYGRLRPSIGPVVDSSPFVVGPPRDGGPRPSRCVRSVQASLLAP